MNNCDGCAGSIINVSGNFSTTSGGVDLAESLLLDAKCESLAEPVRTGRRV